MRFLLITLSLISLTACRKDHCATLHEENFSYDTIYPTNWFPAYPGSYWVYNDSITIQVDPLWHEFQVKEYQSNDGCGILETDQVFLPKIIDAPEAPLFGCSYLYYDICLATYTTNYNSENVLFSDLSFWNGWQDPESKYSDSKYYYDLSSRTTRATLNHYDTLTVNGLFYDSLWTIEEKHYLDNNNFETRTYYYALGIGPVCIQREHADTVAAHDYTLNLTDFNIND